MLFSFFAILNSYEQTAVLNVCCDTDPIIARQVGRKCENLRFNSLRDVLSWRHKQYFSLSNVLMCIIGHLIAALSVIDLARIIYLMQWRIQGRGPGDRSPLPTTLFLDKTEARRASTLSQGLDDCRPLSEVSIYHCNVSVEGFLQP